MSDPSSGEQPTQAAPASDTTPPAPRRIPIGTQRAGVKPPSLAPKVEYVTGAVSEPSAPAQTAPPLAFAGPVLPRTAPAVSLPQPSIDSDTLAEASQQAAVITHEPVAVVGAGVADPKPQSAARRGARDRRGSKSAASPFADALPPQKRVAVPNLRAGLDEDLEGDFEAALAGVAVEELLAAAEGGGSPLPPGSRTTGTVVAIGPDTAFIDLGGQRQGAMKLAGLFADGEEIPAVGALIEVSVGGLNEEDGLYEVAPANRAVAIEDWSQIEVGMIVEARCTAANKGGLECEVAGLRGFMPASLVSPWRIENLEEMVGQTLESLVTEIVPAARRLVLSRRAVIEKQAADARAKMLETLEVGATVEGIVRSVRDFGVFIDIGNGVEGLIHVSQLAWERVTKPEELFQSGQKIRAVVKKIDRQTGKIGLSARDLVESPWQRAAEKYHIGATVRGAVSRIADFGAFVRLEPGVEGLVHISELATRRIRSVGDVVKEGQEIEVRVLAVDPDEQRMSLSIRAVAAASEAVVEPEADNGDPSGVDAGAPETPAAPKQRKTPLKGGLGGSSEGAKFGLRW